VLATKAGEPLSPFLPPDWSLILFLLFFCILNGTRTTKEGTPPSSSTYLWPGRPPALQASPQSDRAASGWAHACSSPATARAELAATTPWGPGDVGRVLASEHHISSSASSNVTAAVSFPKFLLTPFRLSLRTPLHPGSLSHQAAPTLFKVFL